MGKIWEAILDGTIYSCPSLLSSFAVVSFADLKRYKFTYWFAFPALHSDPPWRMETTQPGRLTSSETTTLVDKVQTWRYGVDARQYGFFLAKRRRSSEAGNEPAPTDVGWDIAQLGRYDSGFFDGSGPDDRFVAVADPSTYSPNPGWMLRNLLVLVRQRWKLDRVQILCYRDVQSRRDEPRSIILRLKAADSGPAAGVPNGEERPRTPQMPKVTGWERNKEGRLASRMANLGDYLDPRRSAQIPATASGREPG